MSGREERKLTVPKFSSFKPKAPPPDQPASTRAPETPEGDSARRSRKRRRHHSRSRHDERRRSNSRSRSRSPRAGKRQAAGDADQRPRKADAGQRLRKEDGDQRQPATADAGIPFFVVDKKGDPLIRRYGVDKYKAPQFRRRGREDVLGTDGYLYIHRDAADEQFSIRRPGVFYGSSLRERNPLRSRIRHVQAKQLRADKDAEARGLDTGDFISLETRKMRARRVEAMPDDEDRPDYRSIEGKKSRAAASDLDTDSESSDDDGAGERDPLKEKSIELTRRVKEHPNDTPAWLELIDHQDVLMKAGADINEDVPVDEVKSFAEIKLSMYEKALANTASARDREQILVGQMREGAKVWDADVMAKRWSKLSGEIEGSFALWRANLDFEMSNINTFQYERVKDIFIRRLALLNSRAVQLLVPPYELGSLYGEMIYVFLRATRFFHDCGYRELSVAAWQALLELNFSGGAGFSAPQPSVPESFSEFWEFEAPRIGEKGAMGWEHFVRTGGPEPPEPAEADEEVPLESRDVYKAWAAEEMRRMRKARMPSRTLDECDSDDPYGIIMFSDLEGLLFAIPGNILAEVGGELSDAFLTFCQLPRLSNTRAWETDPFVTPRDKAFECSISEMSPTPAIPSEDVDSSRPPPEFATRRVTPAVAPAFICSLLHWGRYASAEDVPVDTSWVILTLKTLVERGRAELAGYYLTMEWVADNKGIRKPARELIRKHPENVGLYSLYALFEWANGNGEMARTVLASATKLGEATSAAILPLWLTRAWLDFVDGASLSEVLVKLCFLADGASPGEEPSPTMVLRHKQQLGSMSVQLLLEGNVEGFSTGTKLVALLEYLSSTGGSEPRSERQGSISAAMDVIWRHSVALVDGGQGASKAHEELLEFGAMLLYVHTTLG